MIRRMKIIRKKPSKNKKNRDCPLLTSPGLFFVFRAAQTILFNPLLYNIFHQKRYAPLFAGSNLRENVLGYFVGTEGYALVLFHMDHPYTSYTFFLDKATNTL